MDKNKIINGVFKTKIKILLFEKKTPAELYLYNELFNNSNILIEIIYATNIIQGNIIFRSGNYIYYYNKVINPNKLKDNKYIIVGCLDNIMLNNKIKLLEYENSNTILYETIK